MELKFRKLKANEIDIRVGRVISTEKFNGCSLLLYKDARVDMNILDETVGAMNWQRRHTRENANCEIGIYDSEKKEWVWKEDTGTESNTEAEKGLASDSFKRAGVNWGIGRELYSAKNIMVQCELDNKKVKNGIAWFVKEIEYADNEISKLVICETNYGKNEKVVYSMGVKQEEKPKTTLASHENKKVEQVVKQEENKPQDKHFKEEPKLMSVEEARQFGVKVNGKEILVKNMTESQLVGLKDYEKNPMLAIACRIELEERYKNV